MSSRRTGRPSGSHQNNTDAVPPAPPLPADQQRYSQQARHALGRVLGFGGGGGSGGKAHHRHEDEPRPRWPSRPSLTLGNTTAAYKTGLDINALDINESGTHAVLAGRQLLKTIRVHGDSCSEDLDIRQAIRNSRGENGSNAITGKELQGAHDVAWSKGTTASFVAAAAYNGPIILYDLNHSGLEVARLEDHRRQVHRLTFNPHAGHYMLSASQDGTVRMWDIRDSQRSVNTFTSQRAIPSQNDSIRDVKWSPVNGTEFALCTDSGWIQKWDTLMMRTAKVKIAAHASTCSTIDWHPDGKHILSAGADRAVRVWNTAAEGRRSKPVHEIRVPHPVRNARWRPSYQSVLHGDSTVRQCTQFVTSYDKDNPLLHIWDLRRPFLPFREVEGCQTAPTDLLWHSQDLLWTVGRDGIFTQSDVSYAQKTIDKRNVQAIALSPQNEINIFTQTRRPKLDMSPMFQSEHDKAAKRHLVRSPKDDTLDDNFLSVTLNLKRGNSTGRNHKSATYSPSPGSKVRDNVLPLDSKMERFRPVRPIQSAARGMIPGSNDVLLTAFFAQKYKLRPYLHPPSIEALVNIDAVFEQNAETAALASMWRMSQSWRVIGHLTKRDMLQRADKAKARRLGKQQNGAVYRERDRELVARIIKDSFALSAGRSSNPPTPIARAVPNGQSSAMHTPRAKPSGPTNNASNIQRTNQLPDIDSAENQLQLPPIVIEPELHRALSVPDDLDMDDIEQRPTRAEQRPADAPVPDRSVSRQTLVLEHTQSVTRPSLLKHYSNESFSAFPLISNSGAASLTNSVQSSQSDLHDLVAENLGPFEQARNIGLPESHMTSFIAEQRPRVVSRERPQLEPSTSADSVDQSEIPLTSTNEPILMPARTDGKDIQLLTRNNQESYSSATDGDPNSIPDDKAPTVPDAREETDMDVSETSQPDSTRRESVKSSDRDDYDKNSARNVVDRGILAKTPVDVTDYSDKKYIIDDFFLTAEDDKDAPKPFLELVVVLGELIKYHTQTLSDAQSLSVLLMLIIPLLPEDHPLPVDVTKEVIAYYVDHLSALQFSDAFISTILKSTTSHMILAGLNPLQVESILQAYHDQLEQLQLHTNATLLRRLAYPTFPSIYELGLKDNQFYFRCTSCPKPILPPSTFRQKCESCSGPPPQCPICFTPESPYDLHRGRRRAKQAGPRPQSDSALHRNPGLAETRDEANDDDPAAVSEGHAVALAPSLFTSCLYCNHGAHAACLDVWHGVASGASHRQQVNSGGMCPVEGCLCNCISMEPWAAAGQAWPGASAGSSSAGAVNLVPRRQQHRGGVGVLEDENRVGESRAVAGARRSLSRFQRDGGVISGASTSTASVGSGGARSQGSSR